MAFKDECRSFKTFCRSNMGFIVVMTIAVAMVYGVRAVNDSFCIDSEIMILHPDYMESVWLGSNRFGLAALKEFLGQGGGGRLSVYQAGLVMMLMMWLTGITLGYAARKWCHENEAYKAFTILFPVLAVTAPVYAEQYLFILQAAEISAALLLTVIAAYCAGRVVYGQKIDSQKGSSLSWIRTPWMIPAVLCAVIAWGSYQSYVPLYIALVLISFVLEYLNGQPDRAVEFGLKHMAVFILSLAVYCGTVFAVRAIVHADSDYISSMFRWKIDGLDAGMQAVKTTIRQAVLGIGLFNQKWFAPAAGLCALQVIVRGFRRRHGVIDYAVFLISGILLLISPFALVILTGGIQAVRTGLVYPFVAAALLAHLTVVLPEEIPGKISGKISSIMTGIVSLVCVCCILWQSNLTIQLFQSSYESYRNDVITAAQMYPDIVEAAEGENLSEYRVTFIGSRHASLQGPAVYGELCGRSLFDAEPTSRNGATNRLGPFFSILGMEFNILLDTEEDRYKAAIEQMQDAPQWPQAGSVRKVDDLIVVKLSQMD